MKDWRVLLWVVGLPVFAAVNLLTDQRGASGSVIWSLDNVSSLAFVVWPVIAGLACADGVRVGRSWAVVEAFPSKGRARSFVSFVGLHSAAANIGFALAAVVGVIVAMWSGSTFSARALAPLPFAMIGCVSFVAVGFAIGVLARSFVAAPAVAAGVYGLVFFGPGRSSGFVDYFGATVPGVVFIRPTLTGFAVFVAAVLALSAVGVSLYWARFRPRPGYLTVAASVGLLAVLLGVMSSIDKYEFRDPSAWPCDSTEYVSICLPVDQQYRMEEILAESSEVVALLAPFDETLTPVQLNFAQRGWQYPTREDPELIGSMILNGVSTCFQLDFLRAIGELPGEVLTESQTNALIEDFWVYSDWVGSERGYPVFRNVPSREEAEAAFLNHRACE